MGTYDFGSPLLHPFAHAKIDVKPWIELGNSTHDTTTKEVRICALSKSAEGTLALIYLKYNYEYCE